MSRRFAASLLLATALVVQLTSIARVHLPGGHPNLVVVILACLALVEGPVAGMAYGFGVGFVADLLSDHIVGLLALVLTLTGYLIGLFRRDEERTALVPLGVVALGGLGATLLYAALSAILGDVRVTITAVPRLAGTSALYDVLLTPFVYPAVRALLGRRDAERR